MIGRNAKLGALALATLGAAGCGTPQDRVVFITSTSLGVNTTQVPPEVSVAYSRKEGVMGPSLPNGEMPSVFASLRSNGGLFDRNVKQTMATGDAADIISGKTQVYTEAELTGQGGIGRRFDPPGPTGTGNATGNGAQVGWEKIGFFGTDTVYGFKIGFDGPAAGTAAPVTLIFGIKRMEFSSLPLNETKDGKKYPSTFAQISTGTAAKAGDSDFYLQQVFASGQAARTIASGAEVKEAVAKQSKEVAKDLLPPAATQPPAGGK